MSKYLLHNQNQKKEQVLRDMEHEPIFFMKGPNAYQKDISHTSFSPSSSSLGQKVTCDVSLKSRLTTEELNHYISFNISTADATNHPTFLKDSLSMCDYIEIIYNRGREKLIWDDHDAIVNTVWEWVKRHCGSRGSDVYQFMRDWRNELNTVAGTQVTNAASQRFYVPLTPFLDVLVNTISSNFINDIRIIWRAAPTPADSIAANKLGIISNTTSAAYDSDCSITDIQFRRHYNELGDPRTSLMPNLKDVIVPILKHQIITYENISWTTAVTDSKQFKISDIGKRPLAQDLVVFVRARPAAYNTSTLGECNSGSAYIKWSITELQGERRKLSFLNADNNSVAAEATRLLQAFEIEHHRNEYGMDGPIELHSQSTDLVKYYGAMTTIPLNWIKIEREHRDVVNTVDTSVVDYDVTLQCAETSTSANSDLVVMLRYYDLYRFNAANQLELINQ